MKCKISRDYYEFDCTLEGFTQGTKRKSSNQQANETAVAILRAPQPPWTAGGHSGDSAVFFVFFPLKLSVTEGSHTHRWCLSCLVLEGPRGGASLEIAARADGEVVSHMLLTSARAWLTDRAAKKHFFGSESTCSLGSGPEKMVTREVLLAR